ncbi:hypothetical protein [Escherichia coli]|uniref:hypothetical protein n=1 Tax=Escherichia coli TaxID=562 RepID=UPI003890ECA0
MRAWWLCRSSRLNVESEAVERRNRRNLSCGGFERCTADGTLIEANPRDVTFREVRIENGLLLLNGKPLLIRGVVGRLTSSSAWSGHG